MVNRPLKFFQAINEAIDLCMTKDPAVYIMGLGVPDPKGIFGTTLGLLEKHGRGRVMDMPTSENGMTGVAIGSAIVGMRPILTHQRMDFTLYSIEQIVNQAEKWHYMFAGQMKVPLVIRMIVGRGWGQGPQHSQSLQAWFAHIPGLKVVMPATPYDAKGLLIASVEDNNPVIFIEHRWLYNIFGNVPEGVYRVPLGRARIAREGKDITIVATSHMVLEALRAAEVLSSSGIQGEVVDIRSLKPLDKEAIVESVRKTGRVIAVDGAWRTAGISAEILAIVAEEAYLDLKCKPQRVTFPEAPTPTTRALADHYYPRAIHILNAARKMMELPEKTEEELGMKSDTPLDIPEAAFTGPF